MTTIQSQLVLLGLLATGSNGELGKNQIQDLSESINDLFDLLKLKADVKTLIVDQTARLADCSDDEAEELISDAIEAVGEAFEPEILTEILNALESLAVDDDSGFLETLEGVWFDE